MRIPQKFARFIGEALVTADSAALVCDGGGNRERRGLQAFSQLKMHYDTETDFPEFIVDAQCVRNAFILASTRGATAAAVKMLADNWDHLHDPDYFAVCCC